MKRQDDLRKLLKEDIEDKSMRIWTNAFLFIGVSGLAISVYVLVMMIVSSNNANVSDLTGVVALLISSLFLCFLGCCTLWMESIAASIRQINLLLKYQSGIISIKATTEDKKTGEES